MDRKNLQKTILYFTNGQIKQSQLKQVKILFNKSDPNNSSHKNQGQINIKFNHKHHLNIYTPPKAVYRYGSQPKFNMGYQETRQVKKNQVNRQVVRKQLNRQVGKIKGYNDKSNNNKNLIHRNDLTAEYNYHQNIISDNIIQNNIIQDNKKGNKIKISLVNVSYAKKIINHPHPNQFNNHYDNRITKIERENQNQNQKRRLNQSNQLDNRLAVSQCRQIEIPPDISQLNKSMSSKVLSLQQKIHKISNQIKTLKRNQQLSLQKMIKQNPQLKRIHSTDKKVPKYQSNYSNTSKNTQKATPIKSILNLGYSTITKKNNTDSKYEGISQIKKKLYFETPLPINNCTSYYFQTPKKQLQNISQEQESKFSFSSPNKNNKLLRFTQSNQSPQNQPQPTTGQNPQNINQLSLFKVNQ